MYRLCTMWAEAHHAMHGVRKNMHGKSYQQKILIKLQAGLEVYSNQSPYIGSQQMVRASHFPYQAEDSIHWSADLHSEIAPCNSAVLTHISEPLVDIT